ncbi:protein of unknown function (DU1801) [Nonlabens sp. Hel1_33_55]|uniref:DUF1801 domain-containing protein n=1 Tax=Nonlabens sp. Hel1_33_55 TaxID=1336802 RepID=UPI000875E849|nr:DUF1801 domain-containing protein [Nonlabens sp. Hel1_33_55]SCY12352.1 protein of unknown function (DU1801) [Nonlabens sp. Hel1_33_55]
MTSKATSPEEYIKELTEDRKTPMERLRNVILSNLPNGYEETMSYGMIAYQVPLAKYPEGYHAGKGQTPLPFINLASQKNHIALYHMGIYANPQILDWFKQEYPEHAKTKLDMGKSCIRFKKMNDIPFDLIAELCGKISVEEWIETYEEQIKR